MPQREAGNLATGARAWAVKRWSTGRSAFARPAVLLRRLRPSARLVVGAALAVTAGRSPPRGYARWPRRWRPGYAYLVAPLLKAVLAGGAYTSPGQPAEHCCRRPLVVLALVKAAAQCSRAGWMQASGQRVAGELRRRDLDEHLLQLSPAFFERGHSGDLLAGSPRTWRRWSSPSPRPSPPGSATRCSSSRSSGCAWCSTWRLFALSFVVFPAALIPIDPLRAGGEARGPHHPGQPRRT